MRDGQAGVNNIPGMPNGNAEGIYMLLLTLIGSIAPMDKLLSS